MAVSGGLGAVGFAPASLYAAAGPGGASGPVSAFPIDATTGALGSPVAAPAKATGGVTTDPYGRFCYATGGGISAFSIATSGDLTPLAGSPFATGSNPAAVATNPSGRFAYVANRGDGNVSAFAIAPATGALTPIPGLPLRDRQLALLRRGRAHGPVRLRAERDARRDLGVRDRSAHGSARPGRGLPVRGPPLLDVARLHAVGFGGRPLGPLCVLHLDGRRPRLRNRYERRAHGARRVPLPSPRERHQDPRRGRGPHGPIPLRGRLRLGRGQLRRLGLRDRIRRRARSRRSPVRRSTRGELVRHRGGGRCQRLRSLPLRRHRLRRDRPGVRDRERHGGAHLVPGAPFGDPSSNVYGVAVTGRIQFE